MQIWQTETPDRQHGTGLVKLHWEHVCTSTSTTFQGKLAHRGPGPLLRSRLPGCEACFMARAPRHRRVCRRLASDWGHRNGLSQARLLKDRSCLSDRRKTGQDFKINPRKDNCKRRKWQSMLQPAPSLGSPRSFPSAPTQTAGSAT